jgi:hypothetical protein
MTSRRVRPGTRYVYAWGNNPRRAELKGRTCRLVASGAMGTVLVEFDGGERVTTSRRALRRVRPAPAGKDLDARRATV